MAQGAVIDLTALDSDDEDTPYKNVALVQRASAGWAGAGPAAKRRRTSPQVERRPACLPQVRARSMPDIGCLSLRCGRKSWLQSLTSGSAA